MGREAAKKRGKSAGAKERTVKRKEKENIPKGQEGGVRAQERKESRERHRSKSAVRDKEGVSAKPKVIGCR